MENLTGMNKYVGLRYVPLVDGEWTKTLPYEPLVIVTYQGNSYTSKTYVPAGIDITNDQYWVQTGNYNAQVEKYREEVAELSNTVKHLNDKKYIFIGDSYMLGYAGDGQTPFTSYAKIVINNLGLNAKILARNGIGFESETGGKNYLGLLQDYALTISDAERNSITDIFCIGGYNDRHITYDLIRGKMKTFAAWSKVNFPNAKLRTGFVGNDWKSVDYQYLTRAKSAYLTGGDYGWAAIGGLENVLHKQDYFIDDMIHPNQMGHVVLAQFLGSYINGGNVDVIFPPITVTPPPTAGGIQFGTWRETVAGGYVNLTLHDSFALNVSSITGSDINWKNWFDVTGAIPNTFICGQFDPRCSGGCLIQLTPENKWVSGAYSIKIENSVMKMQLAVHTFDYTTEYRGTIGMIRLLSFNMNCPLTLC